MSSQLGLDFSPPAAPLPLHLEHAPEARERLKRSCQAMLDRLRLGPATGLELQRAGAGQRIGARVYDLRGAGYDIRKRMVSEAAGVWLYWLAE